MSFDPCHKPGSIISHRPDKSVKLLIIISASYDGNCANSVVTASDGSFVTLHRNVLARNSKNFSLEFTQHEE